jgi:hypothetical protein
MVALPIERTTAAKTRAFSVLIESEPKLWIAVSTCFLHANRYPHGSKTL